MLLFCRFTKILVAIFTLICLNAAQANYLFSPQLQIELDTLKTNPRAVIDTYEPQFKNGQASTSSLSKLEVLYLLNQAYYSQLMPEHALNYALEALNEVKSEVDSLWYNTILVDLSLAYELTGQASIANQYAQSAIAWAQANENYVLLQKAYLAKGLNELTLGQYDQALGTFGIAYQMSNKYSGTLPTGHIAYHIALAHEYSGNDAQAIVFFEQATDYYKDTDQIIDYSDALYGLARAHKLVGNYDVAFTLFMQSMDISVERNDIQGQAYTFKELSGIYLHNNDVNNAHLALIEALKKFTIANNPYMLAEVHRLLAQFAKNSESVGHAIHLTEIALTYTSGDSLKPHYINLLALKSELLALRGEYQSAYKTSQLAFKEQQNYSKQNSKENYERLRAEFNLLQTEDQNRLLLLENDKVVNQLVAKQQQSYLLIACILLMITITVAAMLLYMQSKRVQGKLSALANTDSLTQLSNRRTAFATLSRQLKLARREKYPLAIALLDLDHFKQINDKYGHPAGDKILIGFAKLASNMFRDSDTIARIGGEEFLFIFPYTSVQMAQDLIIEFTDKLRFDEAVTHVIGEALTCSVGITDASLYESEQVAITIADKAMYNAKRIGRDAIVIDNDDAIPA